MQKTAQKRNFIEKLKEMSNISGIAAEKFFNPEFEKVMNSLREADNKIRAIATGKDIEGESLGADSISLKDLLKNAKSNINRREYMTVVADLGRFHNKMFEIINIIKQLNLNVDKVHHEFLFKDLGDEQKQQLLNLHKKFSDNHNASLIKQAGIMDFFYNIGTKRGRALAAWEKRYPKQVGKLKRETSALLGVSEKLFNTLIESLKEMSSARNSRNVDNYIKGTTRINSVFDTYDAGFKTYYQDNIKNFLMQTDFLPKEETAPAAKIEDSKEMSKQEVEVPRTTVNEPPSQPVLDATRPPVPSLDIPTVPAAPPTPYEAIMTPGGIAGLKAPPVPQIENTSPPPPESDISSTPPPIPTVGREAIMPPPLAHRNFYETLESLSGEDPLLLAGFIRKYAIKIQDIDPETSINLFKIAKSIRT